MDVCVLHSRHLRPVAEKCVFCDVPVYWITELIGLYQKFPISVKFFREKQGIYSKNPQLSLHHNPADFLGY